MCRNLLILLVRPARFELATYGFVAQSVIQATPANRLNYYQNWRDGSKKTSHFAPIGLPSGLPAKPAAADDEGILARRRASCQVPPAPAYLTIMPIPNHISSPAKPSMSKNAAPTARGRIIHQVQVSQPQSFRARPAPKIPASKWVTSNSASIRSLIVASLPHSAPAAWAS